MVSANVVRFALFSFQVAQAAIPKPASPSRLVRIRLAMSAGL